MGFNFTFQQVESSAYIRKAIDFLSSHGLGYPNYDGWVQKTESELFSRQKRGILALSGGRVVGDLVYQDHKVLPRFLELKNLRVHTRFRVREFARFMLRQVEVEGRSSHDAVICDVRPDRKDVVSFLSSCGYTPVLERPLYDPNTSDISFIKPLRKSEEKRILVVGRNYLERSML